MDVGSGKILATLSGHADLVRAVASALTGNCWRPWRTARAFGRNKNMGPGKL